MQGQSIPAATLVFIDDAQTFGGAQIALGRAMRAVSCGNWRQIVCITTPRTRKALEPIMLEAINFGSLARHSTEILFLECPPQLPLNLVAFPLRLPFFFGLLCRIQRSGPCVWWLNLAGIESCLAPLTVLLALGESPRAWLHNVCQFSSAITRASRVRTLVDRLRDRIADRWLHKLYPVLITPSMASARDLIGRVGELSANHLYPTVGWNGIPIRQHTNARTAGGAAISLWMIGRIEYGQKNCSLVLDVLNAMLVKGLDASLSVVGDGPDRTRFFAYAASLKLDAKVRLFDWSSDPWQHVPADAIVVMPSRSEGMPLVAIEAMIRGIRLVTSPIEMFQEGLPGTCIAATFLPEDFAARVLAVGQLPDQTVRNLYDSALEKFHEERFRQHFDRYCWMPSLNPSLNAYSQKSGAAQ